MIKENLEKLLTLEKLKTCYKEFFVLRVSLFYSLFIVLDLIYNYNLKGFSLIYNYAISTFFVYSFLYIFSFLRILFVFITFLIFIPTGLLVYFLINNIIINSDILASIVYTNKDEASPFILPVLTALLLSIIYYLFSIYHIIKYKNHRKFNFLKLILACLLYFIVYKNLIISRKLTHHQLSYPDTLYTLVKKTWMSIIISKNKVSYADLIERKTKLPITIVMYVGESARGDHFSINGYHRNTSPWLTQNKEILSFGLTKSCASTTVRSLPCMLTSKSYNNSFRDIYSEQRVENLFQDKGFYVKYIGNSHESFIDVNQRAEHDYIPAFINNKNYLIFPNRFSKRLIKYQNDRENFFFLRGRGTHIHYELRYPERMIQYKPTGVDYDKILSSLSKISSSDLQKLINTYDNAVYYNSFLISEMIKRLGEEKKPAFFLYSADHGESLGENEKFFHGNSTIENRMVELFVYVNEAYKKMYPKKYKALMINYKRYHNQLRHSVIWHSLLDGSGFENKDSKGPIKKELSLFSEKLKPQISKDWFKTDYQKN